MKAEENLTKEKNQLKNILHYMHKQIMDIESFVIEACIRLSESQLGFFGIVNEEDKTTMETYFWSETAMKECVPDFNPVEISIEHCDFWAEAIRERKPIAVNDYKIQHHEKSYPQGYTSIKRFLSIPVIRENKVVAIMTVANKEQNYSDDDLLHLSLYLESAWNMVKCKQAEEQSQELAKRLSTIIDFLPDATFAIDLSGRVIVWNHAMEEMTGVKAKDMLGKNHYEYAIPFYDVRRPLLIDLVFTEENEKKFYVVEKKGNTLLAEAKVTLKGVPRILWGKAGPLYDSHGSITGAIQSVRDISRLKKTEEALKKTHDDLELRVQERTNELMKANKVLQAEVFERKYAESMLKESEQKFAESFLKSPIPMAITAMNDGRYVEVNETFSNNMGLKREELIGNTSTGVGYITNEERKLFLAQYCQDGFVKNLELPIRVKEGELKCGLFNSSKITIGGEDFFLTMVTDITELKEADEALQRGRTLLQSLIDNTPALIYAIDTKGKIIIANKAFG
ncbi:MAG: PAS domain S-box protein, partial [Smithella sp.]